MLYHRDETCLVSSRLAAVSSATLLEAAVRPFRRRFAPARSLARHPFHHRTAFERRRTGFGHARAREQPKLKSYENEERADERRSDLLSEQLNICTDLPAYKGARRSLRSRATGWAESGGDAFGQAEVKPEKKAGRRASLQVLRWRENPAGVCGGQFWAKSYRFLQY